MKWGPTSVHRALAVSFAQLTGIGRVRIHLSAVIVRDLGITALFPVRVARAALAPHQFAMRMLGSVSALALVMCNAADCVAEFVCRSVTQMLVDVLMHRDNP